MFLTSTSLAIHIYTVLTRQAETPDLPLVERTNALTIDKFISLYITPLSTTENLRNETDTITKATNTEVQTPPLAIYSAATIPPSDLEACLDLIEETSGSAYATSGIGWSRPKKRKEMKLPDMKYLLVRGTRETGRITDEPSSSPTLQSKPGSGSGLGGLDSGSDVMAGNRQGEALSSEDGRILGFLSFMVTYEDGKEVIYCYEIHLSSMARGKRLGALLMARMEGIGKLIGLEKAMLTVFKSNKGAREFYKKGGYEVDENSPPARTLRNGTVKEYDYEILSKVLK